MHSPALSLGTVRHHRILNIMIIIVMVTILHNRHVSLVVR